MKPLKPYFQMMLYDLEENRLEVKKAPNSDPDLEADGRGIRVAVSQNPEWYRDILKKYPRNRRTGKKRSLDSQVRRYRVIGYLNKLIGGVEPRAYVVKDLIAVAEDMQRLHKDEDVEFCIEYGVFPEPFKDQF